MTHPLWRDPRRWLETHKEPAKPPVQHPGSDGPSRPPKTDLQPFSAANVPTSLLASHILVLAELRDLLAPAPTQRGLGWAGLGLLPGDPPATP